MKHTRIKRTGAGLVELALVLPLLCMLTFGVIEYGWMFLKASQVANAARSGARQAALSTVTTASQVTAGSSPAGAFLTSAGIPLHGNTVAVTSVTPGRGNPVTVTVTVPYDDVKLIGFALLPLPDSLHTSVTMAKEGP